MGDCAQSVSLGAVTSKNWLSLKEHYLTKGPAYPHPSIFSDPSHCNQGLKALKPTNPFIMADSYMNKIQVGAFLNIAFSIQFFFKVKTYHLRILEINIVRICY